MPRVRLVHWNEREAAERAGHLTALGYEVDSNPLDGSSLREFRKNPPDAVVIDLSRLPSHGRAVGMALRQSKATRLLPLVFVEGIPEKVDKVKATLPDARFTVYSKIGPVLEDVLTNRPGEVVVPKTLSGTDSQTPLGRKLGIKDGQPVGLIHAPEGFEHHFPDAICQRAPRGPVPLTLWFLRSVQELNRDLPRIARKAADGGVWLFWPKRASGVPTDLTSDIIRRTCLAANLVDFKICAVDAVWSGMRFAVRKS